VKQTVGSLTQTLATLLNNPATPSLGSKVQSLLGYLLKP
jgi:hypothetical protein